MTAVCTAENPELQTPLAVLDDPLELGRFSQSGSSADGQRWVESALQLSGLYCAACAGVIEHALLQVDGVLGVQVGASAQRATVRWDPSRTRPSALIGAVQAAGYQAVPDAAAPARALRANEHRQALWRLVVACFCAMQVMMLATPSYVAGQGELAPDLRQLLNWGSWLLSLPVMLFAAGPFFSGAWHGLRQQRIGMDLPVALGVLIMFMASTSATFNPTGALGADVYFDSLTMFVSFLLGARYLELRARHAAALALEASLAGLPETALRVRSGATDEVVSVLRLLPGDHVRVPLGQAFPADGLLLQGQTRVDESLLSGESAPVEKAPGAAVVAGSINLGAPVLMAVQRVGADTRFEAIVSLMRNATSQRPAAAQLADRWAAPFLWAVLLLAALAAALWSVIDPTRALPVAVAVLIVTCPCALSLAVPATLVAAARGLARRGVMLQRLDALQTIAQAEHFFFDKTGTLTEQRLDLQGVHLTDAGRAALGNQAAALQHAASLAQWSAHPLSAALIAASTAPSQVTAGTDVLQPTWTALLEEPGLGLQGHDAQGRCWRLGSAAWVQSRADGLQPALPHATIRASTPPLPPAGLWLGCAGQVLAAFELHEALRDGALQTVRALLADGVQVSLLSGDTPERAHALAQSLGLPPESSVIGGATPEKKLQAVAAAQARGLRVVMVGDGINDAPVLARADASLAMGQGALIARCQADAVLSSGRLLDIVTARQTAQKAMRIVRQNLLWAATYNAVCIPLALLGYLPPWAAGLGMACSSLAVVGNALRAAR